MAKLDPQLGNLLDLFTPSNENSLDAVDDDLSAGGVLPLLPQPGPFPDLAVIAGKIGTMYLLNRDNLGGFTPGGPDKVLDTKTIAPCWCGPSYFTGSDGSGGSSAAAAAAALPSAARPSHKSRSGRFRRHPRLHSSRKARRCRSPAARMAELLRRFPRTAQWPGPRSYGRPGRPSNPTTCASALCLRGGAFGWHAAVAVLLEGGIMAQLAGQRQYRAGRGEWKGLCGERQAADDFWPRRAFVCGERGRRGRAGGEPSRRLPASSDWGSSTGRRHWARAADAGRHHRAGR